LIGLALVLAVVGTVRAWRIDRLTPAASRRIPDGDVLQFRELASPVVMRFVPRAAASEPTGSTAVAPLIAAGIADFGRRWSRDGAFAGVDALTMTAPLVEAAAMVDPTVVESLERWVNHGQEFEGGQLAAFLQHHHDAIFSAGSHDGFVHALSGFFGEQVAATSLEHAGHVVSLPDATNVPAWDLVVDHHLFQVKTGISAQAAAEHAYATHPDIGIISTPDVAAHFPNAIGLQDLGPAHLDVTTSQTVDALDTISHGVSLHFPFIVAARSVFREYRLLEQEHTTMEASLKNVGLDVAGTGGGGFVGAKIGFLAGSVVPGFGNVIGAVIGGVVGAIAGRAASEAVKMQPFNAALEKYDSLRTAADARLTACRLKLQDDLRQFVVERDQALRLEISEEQKRWRALLVAEQVAINEEFWFVVEAFIGLLDRLHSDLAGDLAEFSKQIGFSAVRSAFYPNERDVSFLLARSWAKQQQQQLRQVRRRAVRVARRREREKAIKFMTEFHGTYRFDAPAFDKVTTEFVSTSHVRLVRVEESSRAAARRLRERLVSAQREINAAIAAAIVRLKNEVTAVGEPLNQALETVRAEGRRIGRTVA
jgi:hypothetical protein